MVEKRAELLGRLKAELPGEKQELLAAADGLSVANRKKPQLHRAWVNLLAVFSYEARLSAQAKGRLSGAAPQPWVNSSRTVGLLGPDYEVTTSEVISHACELR